MNLIDYYLNLMYGDPALGPNHDGLLNRGLPAKMVYNIRVSGSSTVKIARTPQPSFDRHILRTIERSGKEYRYHATKGWRVRSLYRG